MHGSEKTRKTVGRQGKAVKTTGTAVKRRRQWMESQGMEGQGGRTVNDRSRTFGSVASDPKPPPDRFFPAAAPPFFFSSSSDEADDESSPPPPPLPAVFPPGLPANMAFAAASSAASSAFALATASSSSRFEMPGFRRAASTASTST